MKAGKYRGAEVKRLPYGLGVEVLIHIEHQGEIRPEILRFTDAAFEDFKYVVSERTGAAETHAPRTMWQRRPHRKTA